MTTSLLIRQASLLDMCPIAAAVEELANAGGVVERGAIFTRREVVDFILDLCGYTADKALAQSCLLEPSFGEGDFLLPAIERLLHSWSSGARVGSPLALLGDAIRAVELHSDTYARTHAAVVARLEKEGFGAGMAEALTNRWLLHADFLLADIPESFDFVVGNPPYVRQELIPAVLLSEYKARYSTIYDRADLYIPFIERSLLSLKLGGALGFICADRWMKNRYGGPLRELVASQFHLKFYVDMSDTAAFHSDVVAYPAITVIAREKPGLTRIARRPETTRAALSRLSAQLVSDRLPEGVGPVAEIAGIASKGEPWILESSDELALLRRLERDFVPLEAAGCKVGIGVATGADKAFIGLLHELDVEEDRKLPLAMTRDIQTGRVVWQGYGVINPFVDGPGSGLVDLEHYPRLKRYLEARRDQISARHVAQKAPANWYRTIDRITASLAAKPKLLIPDIKGDAQIVYEDGKLYPHHNLYFVTSEEWDLQALQAVLLSGIARLFVLSYSTKMRGGFLRFQAQYLRRIRVPPWKDVPHRLRADLSAAGRSLDIADCNRATVELYGLTDGEVARLGADGG